MLLRARAGVVWTGNAYQTGDCALEIARTWVKDIGYREIGCDSTRWRCCILTRTWLLSIPQWQAQHIRDTSGVPSSKLKVASL